MRVTVLLSILLLFIHARLQCVILYTYRLMQEIWIRLPAEAIFFAINLLQFFKIKFGKFGGIINISD